jgi:hypothetical protein
MMFALKSKLITWSHNKLSLAGRILVANYMVLSGVLEPQPANVCSGEGSNQEFHLEQKRRANTRQS